jgi:hypothetical protein
MANTVVRSPATTASRGSIRSDATYQGSGQPVTVFPATIGGAFTSMIAYAPALVVTSQDGGRTNQAGYTGSGSAINVNHWFTDDTSATGLTETWVNIQYSEDTKQNIWTPGFTDFALGSPEPHLGTENYFVTDPVNPPAPVPVNFMAFFDNDFEAGFVGPSQSAVRNSSNWFNIQNQPVSTTDNLTGVKCYPANQVVFNGGPYPKLSAFSEIKGYANVVSPAKAPDPNIIYEAAYDCYGFAHLDRNIGGNPNTPLISLEVMFWTYNHNQSQHIGPLVESGLDISGDGMLWDMYMTADSAATGGVNDKYSYCIFYLQEQFQGDVQWVNILNGIRYFVQYYVVPTGPGQVTNPLDVPMYQITRGWEVCSTNYQPLEFQMLDYRLIMA